MSRTPFKSTPSLHPRGPLAPHGSLVPHDACAGRDALGPLAPPRTRKPLGLRFAVALAIGFSFAVIGGITLGLAPSGDTPVLAEKATPAGTGSPVTKAVVVDKGTVADATALPVVKTKTQAK